jgi:hypothetical protein
MICDDAQRGDRREGNEDRGIRGFDGSREGDTLNQSP